jgi:3,5-epimerase/4-reductase
MTIFLIYGGNGWIGKQFIQLLKHEQIKYSIGFARCNNADDLRMEIENIKPTHVISFIGRTHGIYLGETYTTIDYLEKPGKLEENIRDNLFSPLNLALLSNEYNFHFTYLGTGCIFEYNDEHPSEKEDNGFTENSKPNFFESSYSTIKGFTDQLLHFPLFEKSVLNLRIRMPITSDESPRNFITKIVNYNKICSIKNSMTVLPELLPLALQMIMNKTTGTVNLTNPGLISHNEILQLYKEIVDVNFTWKNFTLNEQNEILSSGRSNNFLDTTLLQTMFPNVLTIKESVQKCLELYKKQLYSQRLKD